MSTPTLKSPLDKITLEKLALPSEQAFKTQFGSTSESIAKSSTESTIFVKKLFAVAISNVAYLRNVLREESFSDRYMGDLHLKIIRTGKGSEPAAMKMIDYVKGCFDAIERKYLEKVTLWFHEEADRPDIAKEAYIFSFQYLDEKDSISMALSRNEEVVAETRTGANIKEATVAFLKDLIVAVEPLEPFPSRIYMQMRLSYRKSLVPADYLPPGYVKSTILLKYAPAIANAEVGTVKTNHHSVHLVVRAKFKGVTDEYVMGEEVEEEEEEERVTKKKLCPELYGLDCSPSVSLSSFNTCIDKSTVNVDEESVKDQEPVRLDVDCVCRGTQDGVMIKCDDCDKWQHGICYGVFPEQRHYVRGHVCIRCHRKKKRGLKGSSGCIDPAMDKMKPQVLRRKALLKRTILACGLSKVKHFSAGNLSNRLNIEEEEALDILSQMKDAGLLSSCECDKTALKLRTQKRSLTSQTQDGLSQIGSQEADDQFWDVNREAIELFLQKAKDEAAKLLQKRMVEQSPGGGEEKLKTKTPKRKASSRPANKKLKIRS